MVIENFKISETTIKFFDDYLEDTDKILKNIELIVCRTWSDNTEDN